LAYLVGPAGAVTTVELDEDVARGTRERLATDDYGHVWVICGDGELGYLDHAPYDRIIVTAGAWDLPPAWLDQLAAAGRLVVPLRMRGLTRTIAFEREDGYLRSRSINECGFIPMRGAGEVTEGNLFLRSDTADVILRMDDGQSADAQVLQQALNDPPTLAWTGVTVPAGSLGHLDFWLAALDGFCRLIVQRGDVDRGFPTPVYGWGSSGVFDRDTFAYLTQRPSGDADWELGACAYGPGGGLLANRVADRIKDWDRDKRSLTELWIEVHPASSPVPTHTRMVVDKKNTRIVVRAR
jgi:protein-L-isoaspartate(D-aspartate) O-methyltransferase